MKHGILTSYKHGCRCYECRQAWLVHYKANRSMYLAAMRKNYLKMRYGLTLEDYDRMFKKQDGKCAICGKRTNRSKRVKNLCVDHNHQTGQVRGLLCDACNYFMGWYEENAGSIADYLLTTQGYGDDV